MPPVLRTCEYFTRFLTLPSASWAIVKPEESGCRSEQNCRRNDQAGHSRNLFISLLNSQLSNRKSRGWSRLCCCGLLTHSSANLHPFSEQRSNEGGSERQRTEKEDGRGFEVRKEITSYKIVAATFRRSRNIRGQVDEFLPFLFIANNSVRRNPPLYTLPSNKEAFEGGFSTVEGQHVRPLIGHAAYPIRAAQKNWKSDSLIFRLCVEHSYVDTNVDIKDIDREQVCSSYR